MIFYRYPELVLALMAALMFRGAYRRQRCAGKCRWGLAKDADKNLQPIKQQSAGIPINSNLTIHVGNNVRLSAFGLKASDRRFESGSG
ncbi:hypothetical protein DMH17_04225 [Raoultella planticola]|nr:hypothetical protein [Raoultella planticola]